MQSELILGFVLFDSAVGTEWIDEYDTDVNDHKFYQVRTKHYRVRHNKMLVFKLAMDKPFSCLILIRKADAAASVALALTRKF